MTKRPPQIVDLFSGAGGMSTGFEMAGFEVALGIEHIEKFSQTFAKNHPNAITLNKDITEVSEEEVLELLDGKKIDVVIGGPPCQGFSGAGRRDPKDPRNSLFMDFVRIVGALNPTFFVMENVPGILNMKNADDELVVEIIREEFKKIGYFVEWRKLLAADYGVPQKRRRVIFIGCRLDSKTQLPIMPIVYPKQTHTAKVEKISTLDVGLPKLKKWVGAGTVLLSKEDAPEKSFHTQKMIDGFVRRKERNKANGKGFGWQIIDPEKPCYTISARYWKDGSDALVMYSDTEVRMLTHGEAAAIQTFPKDYEFVGSKKEIYMQIGNAVPCLLAKAIAKPLMANLSKGGCMNFEVFRETFRTRIKGKTIPKGVKHNGALGHWIESVFGVAPNSAPGADLDGFEIKSGGQKGSFGDWMGDWYIWYDNNSGILTRNDFIKTFGTKKRPEKPDRISWTGVNFGKIVSNNFSECGQRMSVDNNDQINIHYHYSHDKRLDKHTLIPEILRKDEVLIASYSREKMEKFVNEKFGQKGWVLFSLKKGTIDALYLGHAFCFEDWIQWVRSGDIELDSGMNTDTSRNRSKFRAKKSWWYSQAFEIVE